MERETITSLQNQRVKDAAKLRDRRQREKQGRFIIDGVRELQRAFEGGIPLEEVYFCPSLLNETTDRVLAQLASAGAMLQPVTEAVFAKLAFGERAEGLLGLAATPHRTLEELKLPQSALVAVIEAVEKPGNVGAILRSADGAGVDAVIVADAGTDLYNPNTIRASLGTLFTLPVFSASTPEVIAWLRRQEMRVYAARTDGAALHTEVDFRGPSAIVLGSEADGLSAAWAGELIIPIRLPMCGKADSLNVSATAAVLFYEALRQRSTRPTNDE